MLSILITQMLLGTSAWAQPTSAETTYVPNGQIACLGVPLDTDVSESSFAALVVMGKDAFSRKIYWHHMQEWQSKDRDLQNEGELLIHFVDETKFSWKIVFGPMDENLKTRPLLRIGYYSTPKIFKMGRIVPIENDPSMTDMNFNCWEVLSPEAAENLPNSK